MFSAKDLFFAKGPAGGYTIAKSLRFRRSAGGYLARTPASAGNQKTWTFSFWAKRGLLTTNTTEIIGCYSSSTDTGNFEARFNLSDYFQVILWNYSATTNAVFRDTSAWYHCVLVLDTTQAGTSSGSKVKFYVNGVLQSWSSDTISSSIAQNTNLIWNSTTAQQICRYSTSDGGIYYYDGYLSEVNFIDGQALDPTYFGQTDTATGVWMPKAYTGSYGTNGFYLNFSDASGATATTIGKDSSGNGNNWTPNNISVTAGVTYDSMVDTPTNATGDIGNYATLNPVFPSGGTYSNANLKFVGPTAWANARSTIELPSSGKWYFEATVIANGQNNTLGSSYSYVGVTATSTTPSALGYNGANFVTLTDTGWLNNNATTSNAVGAALAANNLIGIAIDVDNNTFTFYRTNSSVASGTIGMSAGTPLVFVNGSYSAAYGNFDVNFGQRPFTYTPPTGFKALCTQNLPTPTIGATSSTLANKYFDVVTRTGTGASASVTGLSFQPDFIWSKSRNAVLSHGLFDAVRGVNKRLYSDLTNAEDDPATICFSSFNADGYTMGANSTVNGSGNTYVNWLWKANGSGSSNTSGSINSTVSASVASGFSVATFTTPSTFTNATVGHGLGVAPKMIIVKSTTNTGDWVTWHTSLGTNGYLTLNTTSNSGSNSGAFNGTSSTTWTMGSNTWWQASARTWVAYCFAEVAGYSKFGSYVSTATADNAFVYTGFRPKWLLCKNITAGGDWILVDAARNTYNVIGEELLPNSSAAGGTYTLLDFLSNGFKVRTGTIEPGATGTYIYAAFAESPFNYARAR